MISTRLVSSRMLVLLVGSALAITACGQDTATDDVTEAPEAEDTETGQVEDEQVPEEDEPEEAAPADGEDLQEITFITDFGFLGRHTYYFVALENGYYEEEGLDVTFEGGSGSQDAITQVGAGQADLGFADMGTLVVARANDDVPVKEVAVVYQQAPHALFALADSGIAAPEDLEGKTLSDSATSAVFLSFELYADAAGIDADTVTWEHADSTALPQLLASGRVDAVGQFVFGEPSFEANIGEAVEVLRYSDVGLDFYSNGIIASEDLLESDPELVRAFVRATVRGMEDAFNDPAMAGEVFNSHHPEISADVAAAETEIVAELAQTEMTDAEGLGYIDPDTVQSTIEIVDGSFDLQSEVQPEDVYEPGFISGS